MKVTIIEGTRTDSAYRVMYKICADMFRQGKMFTWQEELRDPDPEITMQNWVNRLESEHRPD